MKIKSDIDDILSCDTLPVNVAKINFKNENLNKSGETKISKSIIKLASDIFTKDLKAYADKGGNFDNLTVEKVYSKIEKGCWTSQKECDMCLSGRKENKNE